MFNENSREIITLSDERGQDIIAEIVEQFTADDGKTYIAVLPVGEQYSDDDLYALEIRTDKKGDEYIVEIEDDRVFEKVLETFIRNMQEREEKAAQETVMKYEL